MPLEFPSIIDFGLEVSAEVLARAFADYFVKIPFNGPMLLNLARTDSVDLALSRVVLSNGVPVAAALIARRGWTNRIAAMAIVTGARRSGIGRGLVTRLVEEAGARGDRRMVLEVIEQNTAAVELYRKAGFNTVRRLIGYAGPPPPVGEVASNLIEADLRDVGAAVTRYAPPDFPWQLSGETIAQLGPPAVGYRLDDSWIAITDPAQAVVAIRALAGPDAIALVRAVIARHPSQIEWRFNPIWPEELSGILDPLGLPRTALSQWQMQRPL